MTPTKAVLAAIAATIASLVATLQGRPDVDSMRTVDWLIIVGSAVLAGLTVWTVPNTPKR